MMVLISQIFWIIGSISKKKVFELDKYTKITKSIYNVNIFYLNFSKFDCNKLVYVYNVKNYFNRMEYLPNFRFT